MSGTRRKLGQLGPYVEGYRAGVTIHDQERPRVASDATPLDRAAPAWSGEHDRGFVTLQQHSSVRDRHIPVDVFGVPRAESRPCTLRTRKPTLSTPAAGVAESRGRIWEPDKIGTDRGPANQQLGFRHLLKRRSVIQLA